jgi:C-terminal peptidase prc
MLISSLLAFAFSLPAPVLAQDPTDIEPLLKDRVRGASTQPLAELWQSSLALSAAVGDERRAALDAAVDRILASNDPQPERVVLFLAAVRLEGAEPDASRLAGRLEALLDSKEEEVARGAAGLLADRAFRALKDDEKDTLAKKLADAMKDGNRSPEFRLALALALHAQGTGEAQRDARKTMMDFLESSDPRLRALGALSLARTGDTETPRVELERLAEIPDTNGELAASYLKQDDIRRVYDRQQKRTLEYAKKQVETTDLKGNHDYQLIEQVIRLIETTSLVGDKKKREDLINAALDGMMRSLDEHSSYLTPKQYKEFDQDLLAPEYGGIGAYVGEDPDDHLFTIRQPIYSGPAYRAGLHSDDKIIRIDDWPTFTPQGMRPTDDIIKKLKGKPGTKVKLYIWRRGMDPALIDRPTEDMSLEITREEITIPPVKADLLPGGIAYIELTTFSRVASEEIYTKLDEYQKKGVLKGVILDLRQNTGGLLTEARNVANIFLPKKKVIVTTESRVEDSRKEITQYEPLVPADMPVAVLISRFSASASEIVSGALQDYQRATIVGQRSYGKGSVQQLLAIPGEADDEYVDENKNHHHDSWEPLTKDWNNNGEFDFAPRARMTMARYLLPSGRSIHREFDDKGNITSEGGVEPDVKVDPRRFESWKIEEYNRIFKSRKIRDYLDAHYTKEKELFTKLAAGDEDDVGKYPGFDEFYRSLETTLSQQDVRFLLRREVRGRAQDDRGAAFPEGDYEEDPMLQGAIRVLLEKLGHRVEEIADYQKTFDKEEKKDSDKLVAASLSDTARSDLRHALTLIDQAKSGGSQVSLERLAEIQKALQSVLDK